MINLNSAWFDLTSTSRRRLVFVTAFVVSIMGVAPVASHAAWENTNWATVFQPIGLVRDVRTAPDGYGGMLIIAHDPGQIMFPISVSRVDKTGNELWGNGGAIIPVDPVYPEMTGPVDVTDDGAGGAYCLYTQIFGTSSILMLSHLDPNGVQVWSVPVGDYGPANGGGGRLEKSDNGDLFVAWNRSVGTMDLELVVARVTAVGAIVWETTVWADSNNNPDQLNWTLNTDGFGGLLFGINFHPYLGLYEGRVQRLAGNGVVMWGNLGRLVWSNLGSVVDVLPDNSGGAYLLNSMSWSETRAQHIDVLGNETWIAGGITVMLLSNGPRPAQPSFCVDGNGGFYAADGVTDLFAQHVDINGGLLWGPAGLQITTLAGNQEDADLAPDGFGGVLVVYRDHFYSLVSDIHARALSAVRLDVFGNKVWENTGFWWTVPIGQTAREPWYPQVLADGSGGALVVWDHYNDGFTFNEVYAAGLGPDGSSPALPTLTYINPDAGTVGEVQPSTVVGDYLESALTFTLVRAGAPNIVLSGVTTVTSRMVNGTLDLSPAVVGAYDLQVSRGGGPLATITNAYGVGDSLSCALDEPVSAQQAVVTSFGSQRKMAFDSLGRINAAWLDYTGIDYRLVWNTLASDLTESQFVVYQSPDIKRELSFAMGPNDVAHFVFVEESGGQEKLFLWSQDQTTGTTDVVWMALPGGVRNPVVAVDSLGQVHVVYESGTGANNLYYVTTGASTFGTPVNLNAGANANNPDLTVDGTGLMLTFVRDFWWPGLREVCYQRFDGTVWNSAVGMYFGVDVRSPSVAWDGASKLLFSWVLDNTGFNPLLHTLLMNSHTAGPVRWRMGLPWVYTSSVAASGAGNFFLLTQESDGGLPMQLILRAGNGDVFYPRRRINSTGDVGFPYFCAANSAPMVGAMWQEYTDPTASLYRYNCFTAGPVSGVEIPVMTSGVSVYPNPFNPATSFQYYQRASGLVRMEIYNLAGQKVRTLVDEVQSRGVHTVTWNGRDGTGRALSSGVYFSRLRRPGRQGEVVTKVTLLK